MNPLQRHERESKGLVFKAFDALVEALHSTCDRLERSDFPAGGDTERVLDEAYAALALAKKVRL